ncbi:c-type cytochrome [Novipirellula aureliae]|nr:c-type cytochrome [Novipirellula aureliae]
MFRSLFLIPLLFTVASFLGCDSKIEKFDANRVYSMTLARSRAMPMDAALEDSAKVIDDLFGTPNEPRWPIAFLDPSLAELVDPERLIQSAGPVLSLKDDTHFGLYREHCVLCHGLSGSGKGPASLVQDPYPRDFRHGLYKWKSTERTARPIRGDLERTIRSGIAGTAMPAFPLMVNDEVESLVDYVIYLSIRGEVERELLAAAVDEMGYEEAAPQEELRLRVPKLDLSEGKSLLDEESLSEGEAVTLEILNSVVEKWAEASSRVVDVPPSPVFDNAVELAAAVERGRELFHGQIANCVGCHDQDGLGQTITLDYDDWSKEYSSRIGVTPTDKEAMQPFVDAGAMMPRIIQPRALTDGVFHGGSDGETLYRRIKEGIAGTPMPGVEVVPTPSHQGLTAEQIWDLVRYVQSFDASRGESPLPGVAQ